jgi:hypothetical protein
VQLDSAGGMQEVVEERAREVIRRELVVAETRCQALQSFTRRVVLLVCPQLGTRRRSSRAATSPPVPPPRMTVRPADATARRAVGLVSAGCSNIRWIAPEKPASSNSFSENITLPSGPIRTLHGTQPLVKAWNSAPSGSGITGNSSWYSSFHARHDSSVSIAPM